MSDTVIIEIFRDAAAIITALAAFVAAVISYRNGKKIETVSSNVDGKMEQLIAVTGAAEKAKGNLEGRAELKEESK